MAAKRKPKSKPRQVPAQRKSGSSIRTIRTPLRARASKPKPLPTWHDRFIRMYAKFGNVSLACRAAGIGRRTFYDHLANNSEFQLTVDNAKDDAIDALEREARKRALKSSDQLLMFLLKSLRPDVYRETLRQQHSGSIAVDVSQLSDDELRALAQS